MPAPATRGFAGGATTMTLMLVLLILLALGAWALLVFNGLVRLRNQVRTAWADIDVQLQRRHDLVPQLVATVQGYAGHEHALLEAVTALRAQALTQAAPAQLGKLEDALQLQLGRLFALQEAYPALKASENFLQLQRDLVAVEEQLQYARRFYNGAVRDYNDGTQRFPDALIARGFGFGGMEFFQAGEDEREPVRVELAK
jgi:LemA protein